MYVPPGTENTSEGTVGWLMRLQFMCVRDTEELSPDTRFPFSISLGLFDRRVLFARGGPSPVSLAVG